MTTGICPRCKEMPKHNAGYCKQCALEKNREWRENNRDRYRYLCRKSRERHADRRKEDNRIWRENNKDLLKSMKAEYYQRTKERDRAKKNEYMRGYEKSRRKTDVAYSINSRMSRAIRGCLAGNEEKQGRAWQSLVDYTLEELIEHIEKQFLPGMSWKNRSKWHIDHITPISSFNIKSAGDDDFKAAWSLTNLRPLWGKDNISKKDNVEFLL